MRKEGGWVSTWSEVVKDARPYCLYRPKTYRESKAGTVMPCALVTCTREGWRALVMWRTVGLVKASVAVGLRRKRRLAGTSAALWLSFILLLVLVLVVLLWCWVCWVCMCVGVSMDKNDGVVDQRERV